MEAASMVAATLVDSVGAMVEAGTAGATAAEVSTAVTAAGDTDEVTATEAAGDMASGQDGGHGPIGRIGLTGITATTGRTVIPITPTAILITPMILATRAIPMGRITAIRTGMALLMIHPPPRLDKIPRHTPREVFRRQRATLR